MKYCWFSDVRIDKTFKIFKLFKCTRDFSEHPSDSSFKGELFQSPRPPELDHDKGGLVTMASDIFWFSIGAVDGVL